MRLLGIGDEGGTLHVVGCSAVATALGMFAKESGVCIALISLVPSNVFVCPWWQMRLMGSFVELRPISSPIKRLQSCTVPVFRNRKIKCHIRRH